MATVPLTKPYSLNNATLKIGADNYEAAVSGVEFTPSVKTSEWKSISGNTITSIDPSSWTCTLNYAQDLAVGGLTRYLHEHEGEIFPCEFVPLAAGPKITVTLQLAAAKIGGQVGNGTVTGTATLGVQGKPAFVDPVG
jgi:hypothetical protein